MKARGGGRNKKSIEIMKKAGFFKGLQKKVKDLLREMIEDEEMYSYRFCYFPVTGSIMGMTVWDDTHNKELRFYFHPGYVDVRIRNAKSKKIKFDQVFKIIKDELK